MILILHRRHSHDFGGVQTINERVKMTSCHACEEIEAKIIVLKMANQKEISGNTKMMSNWCLT